MIDSSLRAGSLLCTVCSSLLLATHSSAFIAPHPAHPPRALNSYLTSVAASHRSTWNTRQSDCAIWGPSPLREGSRVLSKTTRAGITRRGVGSMMTGRGCGTTGFALSTVSSAFAAVPMGGPALFAQGLALSLLLSADGFRVREHFVSYGYGLSVASQAAIGAWLFRDRLHLLAGLHAAGLVAYGVRLVMFCRWRDTLPSYQDMRKRLAAVRPGIPLPFWGLCGTLYALLALPTTYVLRRLPSVKGLWVGATSAGLLAMAIGLVMEGVADWQKSKFKKTFPDRFCDRGLFKWCRHPNYLGEIVFWGGVWLAATPSFTSWWHWVLGSLGTYQIVAIIMQATRGLEKRQAEKYGTSSAFKAYAASTPVLVPGTRQYRWEKEEAVKAKD